MKAKTYDESAWLYVVAVFTSGIRAFTNGPDVVHPSCHMVFISLCGARRVLLSPPTTSQALRAKEAGTLSPEEVHQPSTAPVLPVVLGVPGSSGARVGRLTVDALRVGPDLAARVANIKALGQAARAVVAGDNTLDASLEASTAATQATQVIATPGCSSLGAQAQGLEAMQAAQARVLEARHAKVAERSQLHAATDGELAASGALGPPAGTSAGAATSTGPFKAPRQEPPPPGGDGDVFSGRQAKRPKANSSGKQSVASAAVHRAASPRRTSRHVPPDVLDALDDSDDGSGLALVGKGGDRGGVLRP